MPYHVDNAIILAAGLSSRFAPLSHERPKALIEVNGEILIERQIRQLREVGISQIVVVVGYKKEDFSYLQDKFGVILVENPDYAVRNNNSSIHAVRDYLKNSYICSSDNYFTSNPFLREPDGSFYSVVYADGETAEWCISQGEDGYIDRVCIGGRDSWYMLGHVFWDEEFSAHFLRILDQVYDLPETAQAFWETIYMEHLDSLKMKPLKYPPGIIYEFDSLDELRSFDPSYLDNTRSPILKKIATNLGCRERDITAITPHKSSSLVDGFLFSVGSINYQYSYNSNEFRRL